MELIASGPGHGFGRDHPRLRIQADPAQRRNDVVEMARRHAVPAIALHPQTRQESDQGRIETGYLRLCQPICDLLTELGGDASVGEIDGAFCDGRYNVNLDGRKMVGTAQRWRQSGGRPVGLVHGALLLDNHREELIAAVNRFNQACGLEQRVRADSHIALHEAFAAPDAISRLDALYRQMLAQVFAP